MKVGENKFREIWDGTKPWLITGPLFVFYTYLFFTGKFDVKAYIFMVCFNTLFLLVLLGFPRLKELDMRNLKLVLSEIKKEKEEIFATEKQLKEMAVYVAEVLGFLSLVAGRMGSRESYRQRRDWVKTKLQELKAKIGIDLKNITIYEQFYAEVDDLVEDASNTSNPKYQESKARLEQLSQRLSEQMQKDIDLAAK